MTPQEFVAKWQSVTLKERSAYQEHFIDLCALVDHPTPATADATGADFAFEYGAAKSTGGAGWADVYKANTFGWEYKGKDGDLDQAYRQLLLYKDALRNPPLLVVCDLENIVIHTNFTNTVKRVVRIALEDLLHPATQDALRAVFFNPEFFKAKQTPAQVTAEAAREFAKLAENLRQWQTPSEPAAHFLIRLLFCLFAEDVGLLDRKLFSRIVENGRRKHKVFAPQLRQLFAAMTEGGMFGVDEIAHFNGGLFEDDAVLELDGAALEILHKACKLDWASIEPSIFGTLFERSLDPAKRAQLGAHYTSREDILLIVEPVLMRPLRRKWETVQAAARKEAAKGKRTATQVKKLIMGFAAEIATLRVLDPACGSGNFLYVSLRCLLDLEKEVSTLAAELGVGRFFPQVSPAQLFGIERDPYAHELAQLTVWIGYIQWLRENGYGTPPEPILRRLDNIRFMDAIIDIPPRPDLPVTEPEWPEAEIIVGNPPFLGDKKMRAELTDTYVNALRKLYEDRVPGGADLVCYWFEKARALVEKGQVTRVGLLATQGIRGGANRRVLERIKETGDIFWAHADRDWVLNGAMVHVSMVCFDNGQEPEHELDGQSVKTINPDLTSLANTSQAVRLLENSGLSFIGTQKSGPFDLTTEAASAMLKVAGNPNGKPNSDVIKPWINALDVTQTPRKMWVIDFGAETPLEEAAQYEAPFEYVRKNVKPLRDKVNRKNHREKWWLFGETRPGMRQAIQGLKRFIVTPMVSKHRVFAWVNHGVVPENLLIVIARDDDYFFGVLHSKIHEIWSRQMGTQLREAESGQRYTPTTTFETFPFPFPPGTEPKRDPRVKAIAAAAQALNEQRERWLHPAPPLTPNPSPEGGGELPSPFGGRAGDEGKRTLTALYNAQPQWLLNAHRALDEAVFAAYGWPNDLSADAMLERLLELNQARAGANEF